MSPSADSILEHTRRAGQAFLERLTVTLVALAVSTFPERAKRDGWPAAYASPAAHAFSGWVEVIVAVGVFGLGFLRHVNAFVQGSGLTYLSHQLSLTYGDFFGMGALGYVSYLVTPVAWVSLYCLVEGVLRSLDAAFSARMLGVTLVVLPWRAADALHQRRDRRRAAALLGPERPDEVVVGEPGASVALTVFSAREKPWADRQVLEIRGDFYTLASRRLVPRGLHHVFRYDLRHLPHGEVIRGVLLRYPADRAADGGGDPAPPPGESRVG